MGKSERRTADQTMAANLLRSPVHKPEAVRARKARQHRQRMAALRGTRGSAANVRRNAKVR